MEKTNRFSVSIDEHYHMTLTFHTDESTEDLSFSLTPNELKDLHKTVFVKHIEEMSRDGGHFQRIRNKCKRKLQPGLFPILPKKPIMKPNHEKTIESYREKVEDYFNIVLNEFAFLLMDEECATYLNLSESLQSELTHAVLDSTFHEFFTCNLEVEESLPLPSDPTKTRGNIGWLLETESILRNGEPVYNDRTIEFERILDNIGNTGWNLPEQLSNEYILVFIPGLYSGVYKRLVGYFADNMKPFQEAGFTAFELGGINSFASVHRNAIEIQNSITNLLRKEEHAGKKVILVGHSKGGVDALAALSVESNNTLEARHVAGIICIQSPYAGSPFAKKVGMPRSLKGIRAMNDLNYSERKNFIELHPFHPKEVGIPVVSIITEMSVAKGALRNNIRRLKKQCGINCDGLVVPEDAIVPDSNVVKVRDIDHACTVFRRMRIQGPEERYNPSALTVAAFHLLHGEIMHLNPITIL